MNEQKKRRAGWMAAAVTVAMVAPLAAREAPGQDLWVARLVAQVIERLRPVVDNEAPRLDDSGTRSAHHLTIEPGGDALPPPDEGDPPTPGG